MSTPAADLTELARRHRRVSSWPVATVFPCLAQPTTHRFLKPMVTRRAAAAYRFEFHYQARPLWPTYESLLQFARRVRRDQRGLGCRDFIDAQSFNWVQGSDEY